MTSMSDLTQDLVEEILSKVLITSLGAVRSTCKGWNASSKNRILCKGESKNQFLGFMMKKYKLFSMKFDLHGILYEEDSDEEFVNPSIKEIGNFLNHAKISQIYHCDGLLLCVTMDNSRLVIWNPYLGQTKWIHLKTRIKSTYALGYDKNKNHKILKFFNNNQGYYEVYDVKSSSWSTFTVIPKWNIDCDKLGESVDGNTYFWTRKRIVVEGSDLEEDDDDPYYLICFDFTEKIFGQFLPLPFQYLNTEESRIFSCVKEEKLAALYQQCHTSMIEVWITTKIVPDAVSWTLFLKVDIKPLVGLDFHFLENSCFFIDIEKKLVVVFDLAESDIYKTSNSYIIGDKGYLKKVIHGKFKAFHAPLMCSSCYAPSLVQIDDLIARRERNRKWKSNIKEWKRMKKN
ncbi:PREDICTED: F-box/kelch-repeat protein At4g05080-like [Camelina sativa]|uniref:F-box/kelch-repeat protein At4g05080-like n=1 Tax=Camelina sativa TaxID=90675 RepID=A0ABM0T2W3_CAMSA|nr:PREDICTED: F-box/kelch-repeat protein At4g05080-like [Camelina sativa]